MQRVFLIIFACLALFVAGCGDDSSSSTTSGGETTAEIESPLEEEAKAEEEAEAEEAKAAKEEEDAPDLPKVSVPSGPPPKELVIEDLKKGSGATAKSGDEVGMEYIGVLYKTGELFDANWGSGEPFSFKLGAQEVIEGWDEGIPGMKVGGVRKLIIPPNLAYGPEAVFPSIPAYSTLVFQVKLLSVN